MMTRKHFEALALALKSTRPDYFHEHMDASDLITMVEAWRATVRAVRDALIDSNPRFDEHRFMNACDYWSTNDGIVVRA